MMLIIFDYGFLIKEWLKFGVLINFFFCRIFYSKISYFRVSLLASCSSCWSFYGWVNTFSRDFIETRFCGSYIYNYIYEFYGKISLIRVWSCFNNTYNFKIKGFKNDNCLFFCCAYKDSFLYYDIRIFCREKRCNLYNILSWVYFTSYILGCWDISLVKNPFFNSYQTYFVFLFIFMLFVYTFNFKHRIPSFYRFYKRDFNVKSFS